MAIDGEKLRRLREQRGISQEKLALMCSVNKRTIQRAEAGMAVALETAAFLADALNVKPDALRGPIVSAEDTPEPKAWNEVVLVPTLSGRRIVDAVRFSVSAEITYDVEPTTDNVELLSALASRLQRVYVDPWEPPRQDDLSDADVLRIQAEVNETLSALMTLGVRVFLATYTAERVLPYWQSDEGFMAVSTNQSSERVEVALVVVSDTAVGHLVRRPSDVYEPVPF